MYVIKSILCLGVLWGCYKLFLENLKFHQFKRYYLLGSLLLSFYLPTVSITYPKTIYIQATPVIKQLPLVESNVGQMQSIPEENTELVSKSTDFSMIKYVWYIYWIGVLIFGSRFVGSLIGIRKKIKNHKRQKDVGHTNVLLAKPTVPFTFLSYIFVWDKDFYKQQIPDEVWFHEKTHVVQRHTWDILLLEILQVVFWFNPFLLFFRKSMKLNHEFLADQSVLKHQFSLKSYIDLLVTYPEHSYQVALSNSLNYSLTKKRLQMMTTHFSKKRTVLRLLAMIPMLVLCFLFFTESLKAKEIVKVIPPEGIEAIKASATSIKEIPLQDGVSPKDFKTYHKWIKKYSKKSKKNRNTTLGFEEVEEMKGIYYAMSEEQKKKTKAPSTLIVGIDNVNFDDNLAVSLPSPPVVSTPPPVPPKVAENEAMNLPEPPEAPESIGVEHIELPEPPTPPEIDDIQIIGDIDAIPDNLDEIVENAMGSVDYDKIERSLERAMEKIGENLERLHEQKLISDEQLEEITRSAMEASREAGIHSREAAVETRRHAMEMAQEARRHAMEAKEEGMRAREAALEAAKHARKAAQKARKQAMKAAIEARHHKAKAMHAIRHASGMASDHQSMISRMEEKNTTFYYKRKKINKQKALEIIENSKGNSSISITTENGVSKVKIRD
ncbi:hypothetical protein NBT05_03610 [Aquimarina sp. ERC-38]|uniref:M56 family metallopeptidase n=1 Tax=Aquimarina sp. ERC-38 TaxID=2949996 RepID=UPI00224815CA|nr:M56 family metallopeptidase [Aquimarina sp. ERC-38]UZO81568.1 hypothetical protein NBT05_03610 [Aquimarina sp. ERC-38]